MIQVTTNSPLAQILRLDRIQVLKSNPVLKSDGIRYVGNGFVVEKTKSSVQTRWNGKKVVWLVNKPTATIPTQAVTDDMPVQVKSRRVTKKN